MTTKEQKIPSSRETVTVVIPTKNVGEAIIPTLKSVAWADEVIVIDMFSEDITEEVCRSFKNVVFYSRDDYIYGNVNFGFEKANSDWVIRLDSDEVLDVELQTSIQHFLLEPNVDIVGCWFQSVQYMFGMPMKHGPGLGGPPRRCMFRRGLAFYPCQSEHEDFQMRRDGKWVTLDGCYTHFTNVSVREAVTKYIYYAEKDARRNTEKCSSSPFRIVWQGMRLFWMYYWKMKGHRDGMLGFYAAIMRGPVQHWIMHAEFWHVNECRNSNQSQK